MNRIRVVTAWTGDGKSMATAYRPALVVDHNLASCQDMTGADPRQGGTFLVECQVDDANLASILADPKYIGKVTVISSDTIGNTTLGV